VNFLSVGNPKRFLKLIIFTFVTMLVGLGLAVTPANADEVGTEFSDAVTGNVRIDGEPIENVRIVVDGGGYTAETVTDERGRWFIGVPQPGIYNVTLDETTLPEGIAVVEGGASQVVEFGRSDRVVKNFFIGEASFNQVSMFDQVVSRIIYGINFGLMLGLAAVGLSLVFGTTGLSNFAHGEMVTFGAVATFILSSFVGLPIWLAIPIGVAMSAGFGWALDAGLFRPVRKKGLGIVQLMIVSIGLSLMLRYVIQFFIGGGTEQLPGFDSPKIQLFGATALSVTDLVSMTLSLTVIGAFAFWLLRTKTGKATRAISDNPDLAAASGIDVDKVIRIVWIISAGMAGLAGVLWAYFRPGIKWDMGTQILLLIFAAVVLGGLGTAFGALVGALIVGILIETSGLLIPADLKYVGALVVLILVLLVRPQGLLGRKQRVG
jgi:Branched-chain amino acid ABC-type transport system, permease components